MGTFHSAALLLALAAVNGFAAFAPLEAPGSQITDFTSDQEKSNLTAENGGRQSGISPSPVVGDLSAITQRPLFNPARRPAVPAARKETIGEKRPVVQRPELLPAGITLIGIIGRTDQDRMALVRTEKQNEARALKSGSQIDGWKISEMSSDSIVLEQGTMRCRMSVGKPQSSLGSCAPAASERPDFERAK